MKAFYGWSAAAVLAGLVACQSSSNKASERACSESQALQSTKLRGSGLPAKTIALTFDDGPGARTLELSHYLKEQGVRAGFFVMGNNVQNRPDGGAILQALVDDGHVIGNHTTSHLNLTTQTPEAIVNELTLTDAIIAPFVPDGRSMFRPPYGAWDAQVFAALEASPMSKYVGPVDWDLGFQWGPGEAADWDCWSAEGQSVPGVVDVVTCGNLYLEQIRAAGSGVVLLHDPYFINDDPQQGGTVDMIKNILPVLKSEGFSFVRIDEVPEVAAVLPPLTTPADAGATDAAMGDASAEVPGTSSPSGDAAPAPSTAAGDQPGSTPRGGSSDPCTASPQVRSAKH